MTRSGFAPPASLGRTLKDLGRILLRRTNPFLQLDRSTENARGSCRSRYGQEQLIHRELVGDSYARIRQDEIYVDSSVPIPRMNRGVR